MTTQPGPYKNYPGGKNAQGIYHRIISQIRPHDVYMELFLGSGAVIRAKRPAVVNIANDLHPTVYADWLTAGVDGIDYMNRCAIDILASYKFEPDLRYCIYLDPPYPFGSRRSTVDIYDYEMSDDDHRQLLQTIRYLPDNVDVLISTYENPMYAEALKDWRLVTFTAMTHAGPATEFLYMNFENANGELHDYRYLGVDRTDRQRIKRKIAREVAKLESLPAAERNAIVVEIARRYRIDVSDYTAVMPAMQSEMTTLDPFDDVDNSVYRLEAGQCR